MRTLLPPPLRPPYDSAPPPAPHIIFVGLVYIRDSRTIVAPPGSFQRGYAPPPGPPPRLPTVSRHRRLATSVQMYGWMYYHFLVETLPKIILLQRHIEASAASVTSAGVVASAGGGTTAATSGDDDNTWDLLVWGQPHEVWPPCLYVFVIPPLRVCAWRGARSWRLRPLSVANLSDERPEYTARFVCRRSFWSG